jgi:sigma-B regulation protein RsbU (phosphoserine phosphatase)
VPASVELAPGEALVLFTDGVTDVVGPEGERFGTERLAEALEGPAPSAQDLAGRLERALDTFGVGPQRDDIACLILRRR